MPSAAIPAATSTVVVPATTGPRLHVLIRVAGEEGLGWKELGG
jgi:hypothetical protein